MRTSIARIAGGTLALSTLLAAQPAQASPFKKQVDLSRPALEAVATDGSASSSSSSDNVVDQIRKKIAELEAKVKALVKPAEWVIRTGSGAITSDQVYKLCNNHDEKCLGWVKQPSGTGINLGWHDISQDKQARLVKQGGGTIKYGDTVAVFVGQTSDSYLCYKDRTFGINLDWSKSPCHEWRIDSPPAANKNGQNLNVGDAFVLYNSKVKDKMVRCARKNSGFKGAWLKWGETCSTAELAYTNKDLALKLYEEIKQLKDKL